VKPAEVLALLRQWWTVRLTHDDAGAPVLERWPFPGSKCGKPMTTRELSRLFHDAAETAGIRKWMTLHSLRHSFATHPPAISLLHNAAKVSAAWSTPPSRPRDQPS
jgi:site-specific recombinase XerD